MKGYYGYNVLNESFITSDNGYSKNRRMYFKSRSKDLIISGGENINLNILEQSIKDYDSSLKTIIHNIKNEKWGEVLIVLIEGATNDKILNGLKKYCRLSLPKYMVPKHFLYIESLPLKDNEIDLEFLNSYINERIA